MSIKINGDSMLPFLKPDTEIKLKSISSDIIRMGDVVAYYEKNSRVMVMHRIIWKTKKGYLVKGDNNWHIDPVRLNAERFLILKEFSYASKIWRTDTKIGVVINKLFWGLSLVRYFPFIHRRRFRAPKSGN